MSRLFAAKEARRRKLANLPIEEKMEIAQRLQEMSKTALDVWARDLVYPPVCQKCKGHMIPEYKDYAVVAWKCHVCAENK